MNVLSILRIIVILMLSCLCAQLVVAQSVPEISGVWRLQIDKKIDGKIAGNYGCTHVNLDQNGTALTAKYSKCPSSNEAKGSRFNGQIYQSKRGILIHLIQHVPFTKYYGSWSGSLIEPGLIKGLMVDLEGNQFEFSLTQ
ncbi:MAG: hypothetical protein AAF587_35715 [Bacteroidota bacterium]